MLPQCSSEDVLIQGACFPQCPQYYTEATYVSPSACVLNVDCPISFSSGGDFTTCQKPLVNRTVVLPDENGDCTTGFTFWDSMCASVCPSNTTIYDGTRCSTDCPEGFLSNSLHCYKPIVLRDPVQATCPLNYAPTSDNTCKSTFPPFNYKLVWIILAIVVASFFLVLFFTKDISFSFTSESKRSSATAEDEIPTRFLIDELRNHRTDFSNQSQSQNQNQNQNQVQSQIPMSYESYFPSSPSSSSTNSFASSES